MHFGSRMVTGYPTAPPARNTSPCGDRCRCQSRQTAVWPAARRECSLRLRPLPPHFTQLGGHRRQTVGLLHPPVVDIANGGRPLGEQRCGGDGHRRVRNVVHVHVDTAQFTAAAFDEIVAPGNARAHFLQHVGKLGVALHAFAADAGHAHGAAFDSRRRRSKRRKKRRPQR